MPFGVPKDEPYPLLQLEEYKPMPYTHRHVPIQAPPYRMQFWQKVVVGGVLTALGLMVLGIALAVLVILL